MSLEQWRDFRTAGYFFVLGGTTGLVYQIGYQYAIQDAEYLCIIPTTPVPECDSILAKKLWLETNEGQFRLIANRRRYPDGTFIRRQLLGNNSAMVSYLGAYTPWLPPILVEP